MASDCPGLTCDRDDGPRLCALLLDQTDAATELLGSLPAPRRAMPDITILATRLRARYGCARRDLNFGEYDLRQLIDEKVASQSVVQEGGVVLSNKWR